jgi:hypothetical protein
MFQIHILTTAIDITEENTKSTYVFNPKDLIGRSFVMEEQSDGQRHRATVVKSIEDYANIVEINPTWLKFPLSTKYETGEDIITYSQLLDYLAKEDENETLWILVALCHIKDSSLPTIQNIKDQHILSKLNGRLAN